MVNKEKALKREIIRLRKTQNPEQVDFRRIRKQRSARTEYRKLKKGAAPSKAVEVEMTKKPKTEKDMKVKPKKEPELEVMETSEPELEVVDGDLDELYTYDEDFDDEDGDEDQD